jgi:hypothetical protein
LNFIHNQIHSRRFLDRGKASAGSAVGRRENFHQIQGSLIILLLPVVTGVGALQRKRGK